MDKVKPVRGTLATSLLSRVNVNNEVLKNISSYHPYRIKEHERPDIIAQQYYGSSDYTYLIFLANQIRFTDIAKVNQRVLALAELM